MRIYATPPVIKEKTEHFVIDDPNMIAHQEVLSTTAIYIIETSGNGFMMNSYDEDGKWLGDSWHQTIEDAKHQSSFEYDNPNYNFLWKEVPENIEIPVEYALSHIIK